MSAPAESTDTQKPTVTQKTGSSDKSEKSDESEKSDRSESSVESGGPAEPETSPESGPAWRVLELLNPVRMARHSAQVLRFMGELAPASALDLARLRRMLWHAVAVGVVAGGAGALFFGALEFLQQFLLEELAGYVPLRAHGEPSWWVSEATKFRPWLLVLLPCIGGLLAGRLIRLAPETAGGGTNAVIDAFHKGGGIIRRRVITVKMLASLATLGFGGAGGREGPTMHIGAAIGSALSRVLRVSARERRILLLAGVAAGISAVFRTPLGAALLAVEVLYRDGIESESLVPCIFASVVSYSVVISLYGDSTLLAHAARYPFVPAHLPLYAALAFCVSVLALSFTSLLKMVREAASRLPVPDWVRPGVGGLAVGVLAVVVITIATRGTATHGHGLGILGGGYGAVQMAVSGGNLLPDGWRGVELLLLLCAAKAIASALTIGTGGSAGDFAPSLAIGGLFGGAFGRAAELLLDDPRIAPGAFALVGMGAFYGGIAHVPLAALVLVCELAGSYDLLVPLMLAEGVAFVVLRRRTLYESQVSTLRDSPVHRRSFGLSRTPCATIVARADRAAHCWVRFSPATPGREMLRCATECEEQEVFPVFDEKNVLRGLVNADALRALALQPEVESWIVAADLMQRSAFVRPEDDLATAARTMLEHDLRALPVVNAKGEMIGFVDQADIASAYVEVDDRRSASREAGAETNPPTEPPRRSTRQVD